MAKVKMGNHGYVKLPKEIIKNARLEVGEEYDVDIVDGNIVIDTLPEGKCSWCGSREGLIDVYGKRLCKGCQCRALWVVTDQTEEGLD